MKLKINVAILLLSLLSINSYSASYDCEKANNPTDIAVCSDENLSKKDDENSVLFKTAEAIDKNSTNEIRRKSYSEKMKCESNLECLSNSYVESMSAYSTIIASAPSNQLSTSTSENSQKETGISNIPTDPIVNNTTTNTSNESNLSLWIFLGAYLIFIGFLHYAKENPDAAILTTKFLYYTVGFPLLASIYILKNLQRLISKSGGGSSSSSSSSFPSAKNSSSNDSTHNNQYPDRETIDIEFQSTSGNWSRLHSFEYLGNDQQISHAMDNAERSAALKGNSVTGRIRAKGRRTKSIYESR